VAFLVLIGVVEGVSPTLEEASQTLRADRWATFTTVSLPLMLPGLANAFLVGFIESIADFGNPIVLGGDFGVLSTEVYFAFVGGLVKVWGRDYTPTLDHYVKAFAIERTADGLIWSGAAWNSFWTTVTLAAIAAPLTAALGLIAAWILVRQRFAGRSTLEFAT